MRSLDSEPAPRPEMARVLAILRPSISRNVDVENNDVSINDKNNKNESAKLTFFASMA
mgnify:CR=1 FL=1